MTSQSITNKLVANIKQASDISKNYFTSTNVVCIDTSNRRIGIDTKTPTWSIDISGVESYNGVKCHNLDISGKADISYAVINFLKAPTISAEDINISFIYVNELSGNLIDISEVVFNSISGDFIYSNNTITGNFIQCFSAVILNDLEIKGNLNVENFNFEKDVLFNKVNIDLSFTTQSTSESKFEGKVEFSNPTPVQYNTLSGNHINTFSISCDNLQVTQQSDFSSINVSAEASFNTINVIGEASFNTISAESINIAGQSLETLITKTAENNLNFAKDISSNTILAKKIYIENTNDDNLNNNYLSFSSKKTDYSNIDKLIINSELDLSYNSKTSLILPYNRVDLGDRKLGHIYYSKDAAGVIDGIEIIKDRPDNVITGTTTPLPANVVTLKQTSTRFYMLKLNTDKSFIDYADFSCVSMEVHEKNQQDTDNPVTGDEKQFVDIREITTEIIEINANITVSLNNNVNGNKDVDAINYDFNIIGLTSDSYIGSISDKTLVSNTNTVLVFDTSYNYSSTSLHYIGKKKVMGSAVENINYIVFGISYKNVEGKTLSLNLENFHASIKSIN